MTHQDDHHGDPSKLGGGVQVQPKFGEKREGTKSEVNLSTGETLNPYRVRIANAI